MKKLLLATSLFALIPAAHAGMKAICSYGPDTRIIEVVYSGEGTVPCEVHYTKNEGTQVLWSARSESGYCEQKAEEFIAKQRSWGWECEVSMMGDMPADETVTEEAASAETVMEEEPAASESSAETSSAETDAAAQESAAGTAPAAE